MEHDQHALTKKNNALMIRMDRKRERNRIANEAKSKALSKKAERPAGGMYGDAAMRRFTANKERKHKQWDAEGKGK